MAQISITLNDEKVGVETEQTILQVAEAAGVEIPTLCRVEGLEPVGACRLCAVEVEGRDTLVPACAEPVTDDMVVYTHSERVLRARRTHLRLMLANHPDDCLYCVRGGDCEFQQLAENIGVGERYWRKGEKRSYPIDKSSPSIMRDPNKCILCGRCVQICEEIQDVSAIDFSQRGFDSIVAPAFDDPMASAVCVNCGQCVTACPTGALTEKEVLSSLWRLLADPELTVVVQVAPAVRAALADEFELSGQEAEKRIPTALQGLGFDYSFDTQFTADLTIMEEAAELAERLNSDDEEMLPLITSCSPGWIKFCEHNYPELLSNLSTCKSPQQMFGAVAKNYWAEKMGVDPQHIKVVSIMPCTAKKFEAERPEMETEAGRDVDLVLTTREILRAFAQKAVDLSELPDGQFDKLMGESSGAGVIFGATGGVAEAALRTAYNMFTGENPPADAFEKVRGLQEIKKVTVDIDGMQVRGAVAHGLRNARKLMDEVSSGRSNYHFIEVMACPGGCVGGGGQPYNSDSEKLASLASELYDIDAKRSVRFSHENGEVQALYKDYLGEPLGEISHRFLHTSYIERSSYAPGVFARLPDNRAD